MNGREEFDAARAAGLRRRHERRLANLAAKRDERVVLAVVDGDIDEQVTNDNHPPFDAA